MDKTNKESILENIGSYYSKKLALYGETPKGVDWNGEESQLLRFHQLSKVINDTVDFTLADIGCGYGAMFDYLSLQYSGINYIGCDISNEMVNSAKARYKESTNARFVLGDKPEKEVDYAVASGIFNVCLDFDQKEKWPEFIETTIDAMDKMSTKGFSFNCLTSYSDTDRKRDDLFYADPCYYFDLCKRKYSKNVALYHDYGLYEFTLVVRK